MKEQNWQISYPEDEFNHPIAQSFISHFQHFANQLQLNYDQTLNSISLLPKAELDQIIYERNIRTVEIPKNKCIHHLFETYAIETPNEIAIVYGEESITYHDLNAKATLLANHLYANGFQPKQHVGIFLHRNIEHIVAILGILKAGGCYVPLNPDYPLARLEVMIHEANIHHLITAQELLKELENESINTLIWEEISFDIEQKENEYKFSSSDLAYIMFTSGSSGRPKGVPISHLNVVNFLFGIRDYINLSSRGIGAVAAPFSFDVSVEEIFSTICFGGTTHIIPKDLLVQPKPLVDYLYHNKINVMFIIPTLLDKIAEEFTPQTIQHLECILSGLQSKKNKSFKKFRNLSSEMKIINTYGPTEVTFGPCGYYYKGDELDELETPIGQPLANYEMYVVNSQIQVLPDYIPGELLIGGQSVSKGYLNYPELNTQRFIETSFGGATKKYRSGDLVYSDGKGNIHFIGRRDNQVKIRGFRIEIGEVESAISKIESIEKCIVLAKKVNQNYPQLIAYLLFRPNSNNSIELVKRGIEDELPDYAIPSFFIPVDEIPLFPNGKINFGKLPDPQQFVAHRNIKSPSSKIEQELVSIWQKVLGVASISIDDNFFEIGGDSLSAAEVIAEFQTKHKERISIAMFYNFSTIETFATAFARDAGFFSAHPLIQLKAGEEDIPLFFIHGLNGSIAILNHIIDQLKVPNALYAFQASSQYHQNESIEKLAASYVELIAGQSIKKCILCGFSFGGILAFEMAHQLKLKDIDVKLIALDSKPIIMYKKQKKWFYRRLYVSKMMTWLLEGVLESIRLSWKNKSLSYFSISKNRFNKLKARIEPEHLAEIGAEEENSISIYQEILLKSRSLVNKYQPEKYNVDLTLIKAMKEKEGFIGFGFSKNSWTYFTNGAIVVKPVNIHHYDFGEKQFAKLSASIIQDEAKSFNIV
ncbi:MAG: amino acid adenylation domain-containing protein [Chitinophagales bacterium]